MSLGDDHPVWKNKPCVEDYSAFYYDAFQTLTHSRSIGFGGALPIPLCEMDAFIRLHAVPQTVWVEFVRIIRSIDLGFLNLLDTRKQKV